MIGVIVVTHGKIGEEMVRAVQTIVRKEPPPPLYGISIQHEDDMEVVRRKLQETIQKADQGDGVLLLSDLFGGTPSNLCLSFLEKGRVEVVTGVNLPMLIKLASWQEPGSLSEVSDFIKGYGQKNITRAEEVLKGVSAL